MRWPPYEIQIGWSILLQFLYESKIAHSYVFALIFNKSENVTLTAFSFPLACCEFPYGHGHIPYSLGARARQLQTGGGPVRRKVGRYPHKPAYPDPSGRAITSCRYESIELPLPGLRPYKLPVTDWVQQGFVGNHELWIF